LFDPDLVGACQCLAGLTGSTWGHPSMAGNIIAMISDVVTYQRQCY
jgi:hypothetical protein